MVAVDAAPRRGHGRKSAGGVASKCANAQFVGVTTNALEADGEMRSEFARMGTTGCAVVVASVERAQTRWQGQAGSAAPGWRRAVCGGMENTRESEWAW